MFTGIIEAIGEVAQVESHDGYLELTVRSPVSAELRIDQSVSHDGVCLTVVGVSGDTHRVQLVPETVSRSHFGSVKPGDLINLERSMSAQDRFEGHVVQGHVDATGKFLGSAAGIFRFEFPASHQRLIVYKGSISVNGISLTVAGLEDSVFSVAVIPYTLEYTNLKLLQPGNLVNLEFDIFGKYIMRHLDLLQTTS